MSNQKETDKTIIIKGDFDIVLLDLAKLRTKIKNLMPIIIILWTKFNRFIYIKLYTLYISYLHSIQMAMNIYQEHISRWVVKKAAVYWHNVIP